MVYMRQSLEGSCSSMDGPWHCHGAREAPGLLGIIRLLCSNALTVRPCPLVPASTRCTFWRLLSGEGNWLEGLTSGPRSPRAPEVVGG